MTFHIKIYLYFLSIPYLTPYYGFYYTDLPDSDNIQQILLFRNQVFHIYNIKSANLRTARCIFFN